MKRNTLMKSLRLAMVALIVMAGFSITNLEKLHASPKTGATAQELAVVNVNTADSAELEKIRGVGPSIAERILQYRSENGPFKQVEDLTKVRGIGSAKFEKMKNQISL